MGRRKPAGQPIGCSVRTAPGRRQNRPSREIVKAVNSTIGSAQFSIERTYPVSIDETWGLWTTKAGVESWWGPEGFDVTVTSLDLRPGGELIYLMTATAPGQVAFMNRAGMPLSSECRVTYTEVSPPNRLVYKTLTDFVPGVAPCEMVTVVALRTTADGVMLAINFDAMHDDIWTERARAGHERQMRKLDTLLTGQ